MQLARPVLADVFERKHRDAGRDDYQFSILDDWVCDATLAGGSARFINHSCTPNCRTTVLKVNNKDLHMGVFALRDIQEGEELCYDYMVRCAQGLLTVPAFVQNPIDYRSRQRCRPLPAPGPLLLSVQHWLE